MKTTLQLPDQLLRSAKSTAARKGMTLKTFFTQALEAKLAAAEQADHEAVWRRHFGSLRHLREENRRIGRVIQREFGAVNPDDWK